MCAQISRKMSMDGRTLRAEPWAVVVAPRGAKQHEERTGTPMKARFWFNVGYMQGAQMTRPSTTPPARPPSSDCSDRRPYRTHTYASHAYSFGSYFAYAERRARLYRGGEPPGRQGDAAVVRQPGTHTRL